MRPRPFDADANRRKLERYRRMVALSERAMAAARMGYTDMARDVARNAARAGAALLRLDDEKYGPWEPKG